MENNVVNKDTASGDVGIEWIGGMIGPLHRLSCGLPRRLLLLFQLGFGEFCRLLFRLSLCGPLRLCLSKGRAGEGEQSHDPCQN